ncbi:MAG: hypothetical protein IPM56_11005 [Ignavibacteriales bacterium]|nr:MAG: hypothetical protein IPM56_11005 [Ignavibacteriales bacterium]
MKYDISIIAYFDILGFKNIVNRGHKANDVYSILDKFRFFSKPDHEIAKDYEQSFFNFSDCAVRTTKILSRVNKRRPVGLLFYELIDVLHLQFELVHKGIFIRGGLTIGEIYNKDNFIFGPGLVSAYELESKVAIYPRIVVPKELVEMVKNVPALKAFHHGVDDELEYINGLLKYDVAGFYFIDYMKASESEIEPEDYLAFLMTHKNNIKANLALYNKDDSVLPKYKWLKRYHNSCVREMSQAYFKNYDTDKSDFII